MLKIMLEKILIVGSGITGASLASMITQDSHKSSLCISIWDKSNGIGGRMSTSRCNKDAKCTVDLGCQYISATPEYQQKHARPYAELIENGVLKQFNGTIEGHNNSAEGTKHFVTPTGVGSLVKHYLNKSDIDFRKGHLVKEVVLVGNKVKVSTDQGQTDEFDAVVLTMPVPQILQLQGDITKLIEQRGIGSQLKDVTYSSRFAMGLFYNPNTNIDVDWSAKYVTDNPCIRFISIDNKKRGQVSPEVGPSICVHTSVPWGIENIEMDKDQAAIQILQHLKSVLPNLPEPMEVKGHKWKYSQVHKAYAGSPGCVVLSESPHVILAGDAFTHSNFDGCLESASSVTRALNNLTKA